MYDSGISQPAHGTRNPHNEQPEPAPLSRSSCRLLCNQSIHISGISDYITWQTSCTPSWSRTAVPDPVQAQPSPPFRITSLKYCAGTFGIFVMHTSYWYSVPFSMLRTVRRLSSDIVGLPNINDGLKRQGSVSMIQDITGVPFPCLVTILFRDIILFMCGIPIFFLEFLRFHLRSLLSLRHIPYWGFQYIKPPTHQPLRSIV